MVPRIALGSQRARPCIESFGVSGAWASSRARTMATRGPVSTTVRSFTSKAFHLVRVGGEVLRGLGSSTLEAAVEASLTQDIKSHHLALIRPAPWPRRGLPALIDLMIDKGRCLSLNSEQGGHQKMADSKSEIVVYSGPDRAGLVAQGEPVTARNAPAIVKAAGRSAEFAWEEFFQAEIANAHTRKNYMHAVRQFLAWVEERNLELPRISPGDVGEYLQCLELATPTKKLHLAALRRFFDRLVNRHVCVINPAATVKSERH